MEKAKAVAVKIDYRAEDKVQSKIVFIAYVDGNLYGIDAVCSHARCILGVLDEKPISQYTPNYEPKGY